MSERGTDKSNFRIGFGGNQSKKVKVRTTSQKRKDKMRASSKPETEEGPDQAKEKELR